MGKLGRNQDRLDRHATRRQNLWGRQFQIIWADYLVEKRRERTVEYSRRCIKRRVSFTTAEAGMQCNLKVFDIDSVCDNIRDYFVDTFADCKPAPRGRVYRIENRCSRMKASIARIKAQRSRVEASRDEKKKN